MARGRIIPQDVRNKIARTHHNHPSYTAKKVRDEVSKDLRAEDNTINRKWPGVSAVQKIIQNLKRDSFLDSEWTIQSLIKSEIPAEAIQVVMDAYAQTALWELEKRLTVREARWVARLYRVVTDIEELTIIARECAINEELAEPTRELEEDLVNIDFMHRALTGKPGATYEYLGNGNFQFTLKVGRFVDIDIELPPNSEE